MNGPEDLRQIKLRISVLLARSREARARAARLLERGQTLREQCGEIHEDTNFLRAHSNGLRRPRIMEEEAPDD